MLPNTAGERAWPVAITFTRLTISRSSGHDQGRDQRSQFHIIVADVRAAGGTYSAYLHEHRKQVLTLRCLAIKGRAKTTDPVMNFLVKLGDNGVIWKILSFWPPPP